MPGQPFSVPPRGFFLNSQLVAPRVHSIVRAPVVRFAVHQVVTSTLLRMLLLAVFARTSGAAAECCVRLTEDVTLPSAPGLPMFKIATPIATYYLERSGAGLASMIDRDGNDWISFRSEPGSRAGGEFRGFPNAVHQSAGNYFHPLNQNTGAAIVKVEHVGRDRVTISAVSENGRWACRYDFFPTHCTFTMTQMSSEHRYWVLYEGTPGGTYDDTDWWMTSAVQERQPMTLTHEGDIPAPEWIAFGDQKLERVLFLLHHEDDNHPDKFYQMGRQMTVFGFGRTGVEKYLASVPQRFTIGFLETTKHSKINRRMKGLLK